MTDRHSGSGEPAAHPLDTDLLGYLDGTLDRTDRARVSGALDADPALAARLAAMDRGRHVAEDLFAGLPSPPATLAGFLDRTLAAPRPVKPGWRARLTGWIADTRSASPLRLAGVGLAAVLVLSAGLFGTWQMGWLAGHRSGSAQIAELREGEEWREAVAQYLTFYTADTFADLPDDPVRRARELANVGERLGIDLSADRLGLDSLAFKRAQMFDYEGRPLAQLAFLDPKAGPVLLCVLDAPDLPPAQPRMEERHGMSIAYWTQDGRAFLLAGRLPQATLRALADPLARRLES